MRSKPHYSSLLWIAPIIALALSPEVMAQQFARPTGTVSNTTWTASATTLHGDTDEVTPDNADYFNTLSAGNATPSTAELSLTALTDPVSSVNHVMRCRFITYGAKGAEALDFQLMEGATEIASLLSQVSRDAYTTLTYTLSAAEADSISDYTNLRFILETKSVKSNDNDEIQVTWLELEVPSASANVAPTVANPSISTIQDTTADLGGEVTDTGGADVTERGVYWSTTQGFTPPGQGTKVSTTGTWPAPSTFVENGVTLAESSLVYFQAFATNSAGDGFSAEDSLQMEPSTQASGITFSNVLQDSMTIDWTASGVDGSIVVVREASSIPAGSLPLDGDLHADGGGVFQGGDDLGSLSYVVYRGPATTANVTGLTLDTTYFVKVFTYAGTGTDPFAGINYQQDLPQENSQITAGAGPSPPTVTNTTIADVTDTTATLGGEVLNTQYATAFPVIGDWTGDGVSNLGNMNNGSVGWMFDLDRSWQWVWGTTYRDQNWSWGNSATDTGVAGDWDGDGLDDPARYRASTGDWHFTTRVGKGVLVAPSVIGFGANATPVAGSWATVRAVDVN